MTTFESNGQSTNRLHAYTFAGTKPRSLKNAATTGDEMKKFLIGSALVWATALPTYGQAKAPKQTPKHFPVHSGVSAGRRSQH